VGVKNLSFLLGHVSSEAADINESGIFGVFSEETYDNATEKKRKEIQADRVPEVQVGAPCARSPWRFSSPLLPLFRPFTRSCSA